MQHTQNTINNSTWSNTSVKILKMLKLNHCDNFSLERSVQLSVFCFVNTAMRHYNLISNVENLLVKSVWIDLEL